jgi:molecular chaperone GrpE
MENGEKTVNEETLNQAENGASESATAGVTPLKVEPKVEDIDWKSKAAYFAAEAENMRKRFEREKLDFLRFANEDVLKKIFPVLDNFLLALGSVKELEKKEVEKVQHLLFDNLLKGVEMTLKHFEQTLTQLGVEVLPSVGETFNPEFHEAVGQSQEDSFENGVITKELQRGFKLYGRVIRPSKVIVNSK